MNQVRNISGDYLYTMTGPPLANGVIMVDSGGKIIDIADRSDFSPDTLEIYKGILCPGFINTHCHLELSFLKDRVQRETGLPEFLTRIKSMDDDMSEELKLDGIAAGEEEMVVNGIVGTGDISNTTLSFLQKSKGNMRYHTFVELFDVIPSATNDTFTKGIEVYDGVPQIDGNSRSLSPHASYTTTPNLLKKINEFNESRCETLSMHMQENSDEDRLFLEKKGVWVDSFQKWGIDLSWFDPTNKSALVSCMGYLSGEHKMVSVHNTFTKEADIKWAHEHFNNFYWCTCPNANLYIESALPDYQMFIDEDCKCTVGTDSLASNSNLSILEELKTISKSAPYISLNTLLTWATINGAEALGFNKEMGSIEKGKTPGVNLLENIDTEGLKIGPTTQVRKLC